MLIADDQPDVLSALRLLLKTEGYRAETASSPGEVLEAIRAERFDLVLMDLNYARDTTSGQEGLDLLAQIRELDPMLPVVVMTAWGSIELAVEAIRGGSGDFIQKPWDNEHVLKVVRKQLEGGRSAREEAGHRAARAEARARELDDAREIQRRLMPCEIPRIVGCNLSAVWQPARDVSGDYFDVISFSDRVAALCIADVVGKGLPAALMMSNVQAAVRSRASSIFAPDALCRHVNELLCRNLESGKFVTLFYGIVDFDRGVMSYANAGHNPPLLLRKDGQSERLIDGGLVMGVRDRIEYPAGGIDLRSGDRLLLFTDGLTEARDAAGTEFGEDRLLELLRSADGMGAAQIEQLILASLDEFTGGELSDDTTMITMVVD